MALATRHAIQRLGADGQIVLRTRNYLAGRLLALPSMEVDAGISIQEEIRSK
jgi:hypothetical protein